MARKREAAELLLRGYSLPQIVDEMQISMNSVKQYLCTMIGEGHIKRSDVYFSVSPANRHGIESIIEDSENVPIWKLLKLLKDDGCDITEGELDLYLGLRRKQALLGDMYEYIREIEVTLHEMIRAIFIATFKDDWWREGVPMNIRKDCAARKEEDPEPVEDVFCYTTFINLRIIIEKQWKIFSPVLPPKLVSNKKLLLQQLERVNYIRNRVMHPVKAREFTEDEFCFIHDFHKEIGQDKWKRPSE